MKNSIQISVLGLAVLAIAPTMFVAGPIGPDPLPPPMEFVAGPMAPDPLPPPASLVDQFPAHQMQAAFWVRGPIGPDPLPPPA